MSGKGPPGFDLLLVTPEKAKICRGFGTGSE
jgi:hypothetical protein